MALLDRFLPNYRHNEVHEMSIVASPEAVMRAVKDMTAREVPLARTLFGIRELPARLLGRPRLDRDGDRPILDVATSGGFILLSDEPAEIVVGVVGKFWRLAGADFVRFASPEDFLASSPEGYAKAAMNFSITEENGRVHLRTETRIMPLGPTATRRFGLYWFFVHSGSALLRRMWLKAVRQRAERDSRSPVRDGRR